MSTSFPQKIIFFIGLFITNISIAQTFTLKSNDLGGQATESFFANSFGCTGKNISPQLYWENAPKNTKAFAITVFDPDAPTGSGFWHWVVYNIPPDVTSLEADAGNPLVSKLPERAVSGINDSGNFGFIGACPPKGHGLHKYEITVHALDGPLTLERYASPAYIGFNMHFKTLAKATLVVYGERKRD